MTQVLERAASAGNIITPELLWGVSEELWDAPVHGESAANLLQAQQKIVNAEWVDIAPIGTQGDLIVYSGLAYALKGYRSKPLRDGAVMGFVTGEHRHDDPDRRIEAKKSAACIAAIWPLMPYPSEAPDVVRPLDVYEPRIRWDVKAGELTRRRLTHYVIASGIADHRLGGSIGRALDVLNVAAGVRQGSEEAKGTDQTEALYIGYTDFRNRLKDADMNTYAKTWLVNVFRDCLATQAGTGRRASWQQLPDSQGPEIITAGRLDVRVRSGKIYPWPERIALESVIDAATQTPMKDTASVRDAVLRFAVQLAEEVQPPAAATLSDG